MKEKGGNTEESIRTSTVAAVCKEKDADTSNNSGKVGLSDDMEEMMNLGGGDEVGMNMEEGGIPGMEELRNAERVKK